MIFILALFYTEPTPDVQASIRPACWRLVRVMEPLSEVEEVVVRLQGIIGISNLPPYNRM